MVDNNVRTLRKSRGLSIREMSSLTKINKGRLSEIENLRRIPDATQLERLKEVLGEEVSFWVTVL